MKKFHYSLETVLDYKQQILDNLKEEYAIRMRYVNEKILEIENLRKKSSALRDEFDDVKHRGASIEKFLMYSSMIDNLDKQVEVEKQALAVLQARADQKKTELINANIDVNKFEKLKEKKKAEHHTLEQKQQESFIDEFVSNQAKSIRPA